MDHAWALLWHGWALHSFSGSLTLLNLQAMLLSLGTVAPEWIVYPWDCLALEASLLAWALPVGTNSWPVRWCWRWLLFRVVFGMGKKKFDWGWWKHPLYIKWFLVWQVPPPTPALLLCTSVLWRWLFVLLHYPA